MTLATYNGRFCSSILSATVSLTRIILKNSRGGILLAPGPFSMRKYLMKTMMLCSANISNWAGLILEISCRLELISEMVLSLTSRDIFLDFSVKISYFISLMVIFWRFCSFSIANCLEGSSYMLFNMYIMEWEQKGDQTLTPALLYNYCRSILYTSLQSQQIKQGSSMLIHLGVVLFASMIALRFIGLWKPKFKTISAFRKLSEYGTMDKVLRIVQYAALGLVGSMERNCISISYLAQLRQLSTHMSRYRKVLRFIRAPLAIKSLKSTAINLSFRSVSSLQISCKFASDLCDLLFYFTDHYSSLYLLQIFESERDLCDRLQTFGDYMWIASSSMFLCSVGFALMGRRSRERAMNIKWDMKSWVRSREVQNCMLDTIAHCNQVALGYTFLHPDVVCKEVVAAMAITSTGCRLFKVYRL